MKQNVCKYKIIFIFLIIIILAILIAIFYKFNQVDKEKVVTETKKIEPIDPYNYLKDDEKFVINEDSSLFEDEKMLDYYSFLNLKLVEGKEKNRIILMIKNNSDSDVEGKEIKILLFDKKYDNLDKIYMYIPDMSLGEDLALTGFTKVNVDDIYDYKVDFSK